MFHSKQKPLGVRLTVGDIVAAEYHLKLVCHTPVLQNAPQSVRPLGADDGSLDALLTQPAEQFCGAGQQDSFFPLAGLSCLGEIGAELLAVNRVTIPGELGIGLLQRIANSPTDLIRVGGGPAELVQAVGKACQNRGGSISQRVVKIKKEG